MNELLIMISVLAVSFVVGYRLIARVPPLLHTPLMSMTNAISAVTILGGLILFSVETTITEKILGAIALAMAAFNLVGGFVITSRMADMFRKRPTQATDTNVPAK
jgi:NAD(P) transhydrogenase subunit alpha